MTEQEWLVCEDPRAMYARMPGSLASVSDRRWRLLACAIQIAHLDYLLEDDRGELRDVIDDAIAWAESGQQPSHVRSVAYYVLTQQAYRGVNGLIQLPVSYSNVIVADRKRANLFREVIGNPFRPVKVRCSRLCDIHNPDWLTPTVLSIAQQIYDTQDYAGMPILADAMEEAGCEGQIKCNRCKGTKWIHRRTPDDEGLGRMTVTDPCPDCGETGMVCNPVLEHLRGENDHVLGCWLLDLLLGKV